MCSVKPSLKANWYIWRPQQSANTAQKVLSPISTDAELSCLVMMVAEAGLASWLHGGKTLPSSYKTTEALIRQASG